MFNKKVFRESVAYLSILAFALHVVLNVFGVSNGFGPTREFGALVNVCFGLLYGPFFTISAISVLYLLTNDHFSYKWNIFGLIFYVLVWASLFIIGLWNWYDLLLLSLYGPFSILVEWLTKPTKLR